MPAASNPGAPPAVNYRAVAAQAAAKFGVPVQIFLRQIQQESGFSPSAHSGAGAEGIAQFMPATARGMGVNPSDPISSLYGAARMDAQGIKKYGSIARALSAYNSGRPDAYQDPNFAHGQTYNYVRSILGGSPVQGGAPVTPAAQEAPQRPSIGPLLANLIAQTNDTVGLPSTNLAQLLAPPAQPAMPHTQVSPAAVSPVLLQGGMRSLAAVPTQFDTHPGIQVAQKILPAVEKVAQLFGVQVNSGYRSAQHNAAVGGAENSDHLGGDAVDFTGSPQQIRALYQWAQGRFPYVEPMSQAKDHVHISFARGG